MKSFYYRKPALLPLKVSKPAPPIYEPMGVDQPARPRRLGTKGSRTWYRRPYPKRQPWPHNALSIAAADKRARKEHQKQLQAIKSLIGQVNAKP